MDYFNSNKNEHVIVKQEKVNTKKYIYLGGLPPDVDKYELNQFILKQGDFNVEEIMINEKKCFAYLKFKTKEEAAQALKALHLKDFKNYIIKAEPFKSNKNKDKKNLNTNLFVKNLPKDCTPKEVFEVFSKYGTIDSMELKTKEDGECLGYGYVDFILEENANNAMENLDQTKFKDNIISVTHFTPKEKRMENLNNNQIMVPMVVVLKIPSDMDSEGLKNAFDIYGQIMLIGIVNESPMFLLENGKYRERIEEINNINRYGIILYTKKEEAIAALNQVQEKYNLILTESDANIIEKVKKEKHDSMKAKYEGANLVVKNLPKEVDDKILFEIFSKYGPISSARVQTQGVMKDIKDEKGNIIDKNYIYESKGFGYVLFKKSEDAQKAKNELNDQDIEHKGMKLKLLVENFDYDKGEKIRLENFKEMMGTRGGYGNMRGFPPHGRGRGRGRGFGPRGGPHNQMAINRGMDNSQIAYQQMIQALNSNNNQPMTNMQGIPNMDNNFNNSNNEKITVEGVHLLDSIKEKLQIDNEEERTEAIGETLFYFLIKFIPQYGLNTTNGEFNDSDLCSKLTGILIKTEPNILLQIISTTSGLYNSLKDVLSKLIRSKQNQ
jgi:RNA recognition motif-containing protein